jgi:hypothetical protein
MKARKFFVGLIISCLFFVASSLFTKQVFAAPKIYFEPAAFSTSQNADFQINVKIDVESLSAYGADATISFPAGDLSLKSVTNGGFFSDFSYAPSSGKLEIHGFFSTLYQTKSGAGTLAVITFSTSKNAGTGVVTFDCAGSGNDTAILDGTGQNILSCTSVNQLSLTYGAVSTPNPPTATPAPGEPATNACGGTCGSNYNCNSGLFCYQGFCRNGVCPSDLDCNCTNPTPTAKPKVIKATPKPTASATPPVIALAPVTPYPSTTPEASPTPAPAKSAGAKVPTLVGLGLLAAALVIFLVKAFKKRSSPPKITPPTGVPPTIPPTTPLYIPPTPPFPPPQTVV